MKRPEDRLYELAMSEKVVTPEATISYRKVSRKAPLLARLKCWWSKRHPWKYLIAIDTGARARVCQRCGLLETADKGEDGRYYFPWHPG